jgi:hypothetical protein
MFVSGQDDAEDERCKLQRTYVYSNQLKQAGQSSTGGQA